MLTFLAIVMTLQAAQGVPVPAPPPATGWVPFVADLKITQAGRPDHFGRHLQDEHGCTRQETVNIDASAIISIQNYETQKFYQLLRGTWTVQPMRIGPIARRPPAPRARVKKADPIEGFEAWLTSIQVRSARGDYRREATVIPALNEFEALHTSPNGQTVTAFNIRRIAPDPGEFLPPPSVVLVERQEPGGYITFSAVVVRTQFEGREPLDLVTTEETPADLRTPTDDKLAIVTTIVDDAKNLVRVRVMRNAVRRGLGRVEGDVLEEVQAALGETVKTTRLPENFAISIRRIRERMAR